MNEEKTSSNLEAASDSIWKSAKQEKDCLEPLRWVVKINDRFVSLATLANVLARYDRMIEAGQRIITGSFSKHVVNKGETWEAEFSGLGSCAVFLYKT